MYRTYFHGVLDHYFVGPSLEYFSRLILLKKFLLLGSILLSLVGLYIY